MVGLNDSEIDKVLGNWSNIRIIEIIVYFIEIK